MQILTFAWIRTSSWFSERMSRDEQGATAVEYGIMVALIAAVIVLVVQVLGAQVKEAFCSVAGDLAGPTGVAVSDCP